MNIYMILVKNDPASGDGPWNLDTCVFETSEQAVAWAEANLVGKTWRLINLEVAVTQ